MRGVLDIQPILDAALAAVEDFRGGCAGCYRKIVADSTAKLDQTACGPFRSADATGVLYSLGMFPREPSERDLWKHCLRQLQDPGKGLYLESCHHPFHTTAHCVAALELYDAGPLYPVTDLLPFSHPDRLLSFLEERSWLENPEVAGRQTSSLYTILTLTEEAGEEWEDRFFDWLETEVDDRTGFLRKEGVVPVELQGQITFLPFLSGYFYILLCFVAARRPHPYPFRVIDVTLDMMELNWELFCQQPGMIELQWIFCLNRSARICAHRNEEVKQALTHFASRYVDRLVQLVENGGFADLHETLACVTALAELQTSLPGLLHSRRPLRQVLDRRPFV